MRTDRGWLLAGVAAGLASTVGWLLFRRRPDRGQTLFEEAWETVGERLAERLEGDPSLPDEVRLDAALLEVDTGGAIRARPLGSGVVELVGRATAEAQVERAAAAVAALPGVERVVSRVWLH